jgi:branched-chain amino acid transport system substrate-binding protein
MLCSCSGAQAAALADMSAVGEAWAASVNATGGVNGHPVKLTVMDDGGNPATALQDIKQLVQSDHVQALVGDDSLADGTWAPYIAQAGVPVIGGLDPSAPFITNPDFFATGTTLPVEVVGEAALAKAEGKKKLGVMYCSETPLCAQVVPLTKGAAALNGLGFASAAVSSTAPSYAAPCLAMKNEGVDALNVADNASVVQRIVDACAQLGYKPVVVNETASVASNWLTDAGFQGAQLSSSNPWYTDGANPGVAAFLSALKKYAPSVQGSTAFSYDTLYEWLAGTMFKAAAAAGNLSPTSSPAQVKQALYKLNGTTLGGMAPPLVITPGKPVFSACYFGLTVTAGAVTSLGSSTPACLTKTQVAGLQAALKGA